MAKIASFREKLILVRESALGRIPTGWRSDSPTVLPRARSASLKCKGHIGGSFRYPVILLDLQVLAEGIIFVRSFLERDKHSTGYLRLLSSNAREYLLIVALRVSLLEIREQGWSGLEDYAEEKFRG